MIFIYIYFFLHMYTHSGGQGVGLCGLIRSTFVQSAPNLTPEKSWVSVRGLARIDDLHAR